MLYGTYDDPNKHLDSQQPVATSAPPTNPPPTSPPTSPTPVTPSSRLNPSSSSVPPPVTKSESSSQPPSSARPNPHWTYPPPPMSSVGKLPAPTTTQQPPSSSTSSSSYLSSFKSSSSSSISSSSTGSTRLQLGNQLVKADFEIVAPPNEQQVQLSSLPPPPLKPTTDVAAIPTTTSSPIELSNASSSSKPQTEAEIIKPTIMQETTTGQPNLELDNNQIDLKLSKDYRSSGDQSVDETLIEHQHHQQHQPSISKSSASASKLLIKHGFASCILAWTATWLVWTANSMINLNLLVRAHLR